MRLDAVNFDWEMFLRFAKWDVSDNMGNGRAGGSTSMLAYARPICMTYAFLAPTQHTRSYLLGRRK